MTNNRLIVVQRVDGWTFAFTLTKENKTYIIPFNNVNKPTGVIIDMGTNVFIDELKALEHVVK